MTANVNNLKRAAALGSGTNSSYKAPKKSKARAKAVAPSMNKGAC